MAGKILTYFLTGIIVSFYLFPIEFVFLPGVNSKMMLAATGMAIFLFETAKKGLLSIDKNFIQIVILASIVSLIGIASVVLNNTKDYTYASYIISMFVWLGGAYTTLHIMRIVHGNISFLLVSNYLIAVCVGQCISALLIDYLPVFRDFVNSYVLGVGFAYDFKDLQGSRLYGIGAMLDVAGQRFSCILVVIMFICLKFQDTLNNKNIWLYILAFFFITVVGNFIARTTTVGLCVALAYWLLSSFRVNPQWVMKIWKYIAYSIIIVVPLVVYLYNTNSSFHSQVRFGFEGIFNLIEKGQWESHSTSILQNMYRFPDNAKTWLIGDGYFNNPTHDPYYIGYQWKGFYMGTDVGYLRFIYYFGIFGLIAFSAYFLKVGQYCCSKFSKYQDLFIMLVLINFVVWFKVSSDIFMVFAIYMLLSDEKESGEIQAIT